MVLEKTHVHACLPVLLRVGNDVVVFTTMCLLHCLLHGVFRCLLASFWCSWSAGAPVPCLTVENMCTCSCISSIHLHASFACIVQSNENTENLMKLVDCSGRFSIFRPPGPTSSTWKLQDGTAYKLRNDCSNTAKPEFEFWHNFGARHIVRSFLYHFGEKISAKRGVAQCAPLNPRFLLVYCVSSTYSKGEVKMRNIEAIRGFKFMHSKETLNQNAAKEEINKTNKFSNFCICCTFFFDRLLCSENPKRPSPAFP